MYEMSEDYNSWLIELLHTEEVTTVVQILATVSTVFLFLVPYRSIRLIELSKSVGETPWQPLIAQLLNCSLWLIYGILRNDLMIMGVNAVGLISVLYFLSIYFKYAIFTPLLMKISVGASVLLGVVFISSLTLPAQVVIKYLGLIASCFSVMLFGSPLAKVFTVIKTGNTKLMPFYLSATGSVCSGSWALYGYLVSDVYVWFPNLLGFSLSLIQLIVLAYFGVNKRRSLMELPLP